MYNCCVVCLELPESAFFLVTTCVPQHGFVGGSEMATMWSWSEIKGHRQAFPQSASQCSPFRLEAQGQESTADLIVLVPACPVSLVEARPRRRA